MIDPAQLDLPTAVALAFGVTALAATQLRARGLIGWIAVGTICFICIGTLVTLDGAKQIFGFVGALAGLAVGGKFSDWRQLKRTQRLKDAERRDHDARFK
ncbi:MAG: hypothetical protein AB1642_00865 [Pseudomonadota bacterium]